MAFDFKKLINSYLLHLHDRFCLNSKNLRNKTAVENKCVSVPFKMFKSRNDRKRSIVYLWTAHLLHPEWRFHPSSPQCWDSSSSESPSWPPSKGKTTQVNTQSSLEMSADSKTDKTVKCTLGHIISFIWLNIKLNIIRPILNEQEFLRGTRMCSYQH